MGDAPKKMLAIQSELFLGGWNRSGVNRGLTGALSPENVQVPREKRACAGLTELDIPFSTLLVLGCRDPGFARRNGE